MRPRSSALLGLFLSGETGRRAVEETLADWRESRSHETSMVRRLATDVQGVVSVFHVFATLTRVQIVGGVAVWRPLAPTVIVASVLGFALWVPALMRLPPLVLAGSLVSITLLALPSGFVICLPVAGALGLGLRRDQAAPILGQMLVATALLVILTGWVVPATNQEFRLRARSLFSPQTSSRPLLPGLAELSLPELLSSRPENVNLALSELSRRLAIVIAGPVFLFLGAAVRRRVLDRRSWRRAQMTGGSVALAAVAVGTAISFLLPFPARGNGIQIWLIVAAAAILGVLAAQTPDARTLDSRL